MMVSRSDSSLKGFLGPRVVLIAILLLCLGPTSLPLYPQAQARPASLSKADVIKLLKGDVPPKRIEGVARERGIDFRITPDTETELRNAGADDSLIAALHALTPERTPSPVPPPLALKTDRDKVSYAFGLNMGQQMRKQSVDLDADILSRGLRDGLAAGRASMTEDEAKAAISNFQTAFRKSQQEKLESLGEANKKTGEVFLAENKIKDGVTTLPSGLQYKILKLGAGPKPTLSDTVVCNYRGTLVDNTEFDSSYTRTEPPAFRVTGVIRGWTEALQLMPVGSKWQLFIPSDLAYGARGAGDGKIGPYATLIFEVELLSIRPKAGSEP